MTGPKIASMLEAFATKVLELPGVSRTRPHAFIEAKSELRGEMLRKVAELRVVPEVPKSLPVLRPGLIEVGHRRIMVEVRGRRRA